MDPAPLVSGQADLWFALHPNRHAIKSTKPFTLFMSNHLSVFRFKRAATFALGLLTLGGLAYFAVLPIYHGRVIDRGLDAYGVGNAKKSAEVRELHSLSRPEQLARSIELLGKPDALADTQRVDGLRAAISAASREKAALAMLLGGIAMRDGSAGQVDTAAALALFEEVAETIAPMVRAGAPEALYLQAWLHGEGLGVPQNQALALTLAKRATPALHGAILVRAVDHSTYAAGPFTGAPDTRRTISIAKQAISEGNVHAYVVATMDCNEGSPDGLTGEQALALYRKRRECQAAVARTGENAGLPVGSLDYGIAQLELHGDIAAAAERFSRHDFNLAAKHGLVIGLVRATVASDTKSFVEAMRGLRASLDAASRVQPATDPEFQMRNIVQTFDSWTATIPPAAQMERFAIALALLGRMNPSYTMEARFVYDTPGWPLVFDHLDDVRDQRALDTVLAKVLEPVSADGSADARTAATARDSAPHAAEPRTGYIDGKPGGLAGLSTFHVDNTGSGSDATVRLYRTGETKAVRSFSVRHGDQFTARGLAPGNYKMRYRYDGDEATYEALETFALSEQRVEGGTRFSKIEVTLYRVSNGNMRTVKVAPESF